MGAEKKNDLTDLLTHLGHRFAQPSLLQDALTHPSLNNSRTGKKNGMPYERLEFLGDRVLGLIIAEWLYATYPTATEGDLAKRHAALVNRDALRDIAEAISLGTHIRLAHGEEAGTARKNLSTLADAMEGVIGALYLDGGLPAAQNFIGRYWEKNLTTPDAPADPKTALQEWAQGRGLPLPAYKTLTTTGPAHAPKFRIEVHVKGFPPVEAEGDSKREAAKAAAEILLKTVCTA